MYSFLQTMKVLYSLPEITDQLTQCQRHIKDKGQTVLQQPLISKNFDEFMGGVDVA